MKLIKWMLVSIAFLPLMYSYSVLVPYMSGKILFLRGILFAACGLATCLYFFNKKFKTELIEKVIALCKTTLARAVAVSYVLLALSTIFALDRYVAFFGTLGRGEGFISFTFFYIFFALTAIFFEKKDWMRFFYATLLSGWILFVFELIQLAGGNARPGSFVDNPIFLAAYYVFVIFSSLVVWKYGKENKKMLYSVFGISTGVISVIGMVITQTRGALVGMSVGVLAVLVYCVIAGKTYVMGKRTLRNVSASLLALCLFLGVFFIATRHAEIWENVPGLNRLAQVSSSDSTTRARVITAQMTLRAVNPAHTSIKNTLIGWGWDNYIFAWEKFYNPTLYLYDQGIFDRAHNFLLDRLVMTGILGLAAYLALWVLAFRMALKIGKRDIALSAIFIFFGAAFFVQNLFAFDTVVTHVAFFVMLAYLTYEATHGATNKELYVRKK